MPGPEGDWWVIYLATDRQWFHLWGKRKTMAHCLKQHRNGKLGVEIVAPGRGYNLHYSNGGEVFTLYRLFPDGVDPNLKENHHVGD